MKSITYSEPEFCIFSPQRQILFWAKKRDLSLVWVYMVLCISISIGRSGLLLHIEILSTIFSLYNALPWSTFLLLTVKLISNWDQVPVCKHQGTRLRSHNSWYHIQSQWSWHHNMHFYHTSRCTYKYFSNWAKWLCYIYKRNNSWKWFRIQQKAPFVQ